MADEKVRLHPTIIVENSVKVLSSVIVILIASVALIDISTILGVLTLAFAMTLLFYYRQWRRTTVQFGETDVVVERDTLFKLKKTIPYHRVASVNVNRGIANRLFGTSRLLININSGTNAMIPEAVLTFDRDTAERLQTRVSRHLHDEVDSADEEELPAAFTLGDVVIHGLFSVSTYQAILGSIFLAYSIFEISASTSEGVGAGGGAMISLMAFVGILIMPMISLMLRYYDYRVYRRGDTIYLQHGLVRTYKTSFPISRINAIRVKSTLPARLLGRSCIEAEVVGLISEGEKGSNPVLCLLKDDAVQQRVLRELVPEFVYERRPNKQPLGAKRVLQTKVVVASLAVLIATAMIGGALTVIAVLVVVAMVYAMQVSYRITEFDAGGELFSFVNGAVDRETVIMNYDKVQMVWITQGPIARIFGVSRGSVYMLSSTGSSSITSGYFPESLLNSINKIVMGRIAYTTSIGARRPKKIDLD